MKIRHGEVARTENRDNEELRAQQIGRIQQWCYRHLGLGLWMDGDQRPAKTL
ncbi:hypothetical protein A2U01_0082103 [Trifolium medium]|uniref:Uncharacterized protein n=1 Tax=Trifolium medium TaxID=97028 RepID=A0A392TK74_9FABA|nr:hypothetical protein [Trifolium medium]